MNVQWTRMRQSVNHLLTTSAMFNQFIARIRYYLNVKYIYWSINQQEIFGWLETVQAQPWSTWWGRQLDIWCYRDEGNESWSIPSLCNDNVDWSLPTRWHWKWLRSSAFMFQSSYLDDLFGVMKNLFFGQQTSTFLQQIRNGWKIKLWWKGSKGSLKLVWFHFTWPQEWERKTEVHHVLLTVFIYLHFPMPTIAPTSVNIFWIWACELCW